jgi:hypothetical protein
MKIILFYRNEKCAHLNATPIVNKITATYFSRHVIKAKPITNSAGKRFPIILNNFLVFVVVNKFLRMSISAMKPDKFIFNHKTI